MAQAGCETRHNPGTFLILAACSPVAHFLQVKGPVEVLSHTCCLLFTFVKEGYHRISKFVTISQLGYLYSVHYVGLPQSVPTRVVLTSRKENGQRRNLP